MLNRDKFTGHGGFTLLELLAALSVTAILVLAVFETVSYYTSLTESVRQKSLERHRRAALRRLLWQDLHNKPVGEPNLSGDPDELARTTVSMESERSLALDTRIRYYVRQRDDRQVLYREWKWSDIHTDTQPPQSLIGAERIEFGYRGPRSSWFKTTQRADTVTAVRLQWGDESVQVPYGNP